jgi:hypothetical protein
MSDAVNAALANLPKLKKLALNRAQNDRNENRELKHHQHRLPTLQLEGFQRRIPLFAHHEHP